MDLKPVMSSNINDSKCVPGLSEMHTFAYAHSNQRLYTRGEDAAQDPVTHQTAPQSPFRAWTPGY